jgi:uncharacterized protein YceH (UPF0502 family)
MTALIRACNHTPSRCPGVDFDERLVTGALTRLKDKRLVWRSDAGRVPRYEQMLVKNCGLGAGEAAALCVLMLRGPQTAGEIKAHAERLHEFADLPSVEQALKELQDAGLAEKMHRQPGRKESRYAHLLSGALEDVQDIEPVQQPSYPCSEDAHPAKIAELEARLNMLRVEFEEFRSTVSAFMKEHG